MSEAGDASHPDLGKLVKEYKLSKSRIKQLIIYCSISAGLATCFFLPVISERNSDLTTKVGISIVGLFTSTPLFFGLNQLGRLSGVSLDLYENGLIYQKRGRVSMTTWGEIDTYIQGSTCRISKKNGEVIEFGTGYRLFGYVRDKSQIWG